MADCFGQVTDWQDRAERPALTSRSTMWTSAPVLDGNKPNWMISSEEPSLVSSVMEAEPRRQVRCLMRDGRQVVMPPVLAAGVWWRLSSTQGPVSPVPPKPPARASVPRLCCHHFLPSQEIILETRYTTDLGNGNTFLQWNYFILKVNSRYWKLQVK